MTQRQYNFTAILAKNSISLGKVTFFDNRGRCGTETLTTLDSECVTGYTFAPDQDKAKEQVIADLKKLYPAERGYSKHDNVQVQEVRG